MGPGVRAAEFRAAILVVALACEPAFASDRCATHDEVATLKVAALQQQMMVAALTCHQTGAYNRFVRSFRPELRRSDHAMLSLFVRKDSSDGDADYNAFKTKLANVSMLKENEEGRSFCREAKANFSALAHQRSLADFASSRPVYVSLPFSDCGGGSAAAPATASDARAQHVVRAPARRKHRVHGTARV